MEECAPQNGCFFIRFVNFISTLVYSVVWNQVLDGWEDCVLWVILKFLEMIHTDLMASVSLIYVIC